MTAVLLRALPGLAAGAAWLAGLAVGIDLWRRWR